MTEVELRVEIKHLLLLMNYLGDLSAAMGSSLAVVHSIFHLEEDENILGETDYKPGEASSNNAARQLPQEINWTNHDMNVEDEMLIYI